MMAVRAPIPFSLTASVPSGAFMQKPSYHIPSTSQGMSSQGPDRSSVAQGDQSTKTPSKQEAGTSDQSLASSVSSGADINAIDELEGHDQFVSREPHTREATQRGLASPVKSGALKIDIEQSSAHNSSNTKDDEQPRSVIHAPLGFGKFNRIQPKPTVQREVPSSDDPFDNAEPSPPSSAMLKSSASTPSSESVASDVTVTRVVGEDTEKGEKPPSMPLLQTQLPVSPDWTKTPRAQTRRDLGVANRSSSSLASISETEDDDQDQPVESSGGELDDEDRLAFYRSDKDEIPILQSALGECWTLCNTLAGLSYIHREKMFSRKGNMQQQAWKSCWKLCQNLYNARDETTPMNVRLTLDLCREFCQALFDVRARGDEVADSVLRVSFELNNHLFNTHDRNLPEAFSERTLDFYITLCHRLMKQRASVVEDTGSLLRACWSLAEMLFSIRQSRRDSRGPDEELLSSAIQACWELCDLFRDGWTQIRPERHTPRPAQTTLTQAFQQSRKQVLLAPNTSIARLLPETPTTIFEDITSDSPFEANAPNIMVLGPGESVSEPYSATSGYSPTQHYFSRQPQPQQGPRKSGYRWPSVASHSSITTLSTASEESHGSSLRTVRSPSDDPNMALLKSLFVRAAMHTKRGFSPLASTNTTKPSPSTSLPLFVKNLPEVAFGSQAWQMSLLDNYRQTVANDQTFRALGIAANPTLLGIEGDESTRTRVRVDTARAVLSILSGSYGWSWLKDLFRFVFGSYVEDVLGADEK